MLISEITDFTCSTITEASVRGSEPFRCGLVFDLGLMAGIQHDVAKERTSVSAQ